MHPGDEARPGTRARAKISAGPAKVLVRWTTSAAPIAAARARWPKGSAAP